MAQQSTLRTPARSAVVRLACGLTALGFTACGAGVARQAGAVAVPTTPPPSASVVPPFAMNTVPASAFTSDDMTVVRSSVSPSIAADAASRTAELSYHADRALETVLADVSKPGFQKTCWLVSLPPQFASPFEVGIAPASAGGTTFRATSATPRPATYLVVFVDASSGQPLFAFSGN